MCTELEKLIFKEKHLDKRNENRDKPCLLLIKSEPVIKYILILPSLKKILAKRITMLELLICARTSNYRV